MVVPHIIFTICFSTVASPTFLAALLCAKQTHTEFPFFAVKKYPMSSEESLLLSASNTEELADELKPSMDEQQQQIKMEVCKREEQPESAGLAAEEAAPAVVASHYNAIPEIGIQRRNDSRILHLRNMNNWMKSQLIGDFLERLQHEGCRRARVMDLACGKGGDLRKWRIGNIGQIVMTDIADISLQDSRDRYQKLRDRRTGRPPFGAHFVQADLTQTNLAELLPPEAPTQFDISSCQFALHYSFRSEAQARRMLANCTAMLQPGGYFVGTVTNASAIMHYLRKSAGGTFANRICSVSIDPQQQPLLLDPGTPPPPLFGAQIQFQLEGVVNCPEYLCHFPLLQRLLEEQGMELVYALDFPDAIDHYLKVRGREALDLMRRMDALELVERGRLVEGRDADEYGPAIVQLEEAQHPQGQEGGEQRQRGSGTVGTLSKSEWEVVTMYKVFAFRKREAEIAAVASSAGETEQQKMSSSSSTVGGESQQQQQKDEKPSSST